MFELLTAMAEGNGEVSIENKDIKHEPDPYVERTEDYPKLIDYGLDKTVAAKLDEIYKTGEISSKVCINTHISSCQVTSTRHNFVHKGESK